MPLYEYRCQTCDTRFERLEKASEPQEGACPECGGAARRLLSAPALQFKGSGWYVNDYGKGNGDATRATGRETEKASAAAESSTDSKVKPQTDTKTSTRGDSKVA